MIVAAAAVCVGSSAPLAAALVAHGHGIRELVPLQRSLEDVFVDLVGTTGEEGR